jgi:hypothetical protein
MARVIGKLTALDVSRATKAKNDGGGLWLDVDYSLQRHSRNRCDSSREMAWRS